MAERSRATHLMTRQSTPRETLMAAPRKSAKRPSTKKGSRAKGSSSSKKKSAKAAKTTARKRSARKRSKTARGGLNTVRQVGKKTWKTLKTTTAQVVEGVRETFGG